MARRSDVVRVPDWLLVIALLLTLPIGLILMWVASDWQIRNKRIVTSVVFPILGAWWVTRFRVGPWPVWLAAWLVAGVWAVSNAYLIQQALTAETL